jgi:hypothetical protein
MNTKRILTFLILFLLTIVLTTTRPSSALHFVDRPTAFGEGEFTFRNMLHNRIESWAFSFDATVNKNGKGKGRAQFDNLTTQTGVEIKLDCVSIFTSEAVMSGRVQHSDDSDFPKGVNVIFAAIDGSQVPVPFFRDQITPIFTFEGFDFDCTAGGPLTILPLDSGDIVVQP